MKGGIDFSEAFNLSVSRGVYGSVPDTAEFLTQEIESVVCMPSWASYDINVTFSNGQHTITHSESYGGLIRDMLVPLDIYEPTNDTAEGWPKPLLNFLTGLNHFALIDAIMAPLSGNYTMTQTGSYFGTSTSGLFCGKSTNKTMRRS